MALTCTALLGLVQTANAQETGVLAVQDADTAGGPLNQAGAKGGGNRKKAEREAPKPQPTRRLVFKSTKDGAGNPVELQMNVFAPPDLKAGDKRPAFVFFFGGGWNLGNRNLLSSHCAYFASRGMVGVAPDYRVKNRHQTTPFECVADGKSAIRYVRAHAAELGIDPDRIVAAGTSAGGHVAASTAILPGLEETGEDTAVSSAPNALVLYNSVIDNSPTGWGNKRLGNRWEEISPLQHVRPGLPPTIVFHGDADKSVPYANAVSFKEAMDKAGNRCELVTFPGVGHGFIHPFDSPIARQAIYDTDKFLASLGYLQGEPTIQLNPAPNTGKEAQPNDPATD